MKKLLALLAFASLAFAATPVITDTLKRIQFYPETGKAIAEFEKSVTIDGVTLAQPWTQVTWQVGADKSVTVAGKTYTYSEVTAAVLAIVAQEKATQ